MQDHTNSQVLDLQDITSKCWWIQIITRVTTRTSKLGDNIGEGLDSDVVFGGELLKVHGVCKVYKVNYSMIALFFTYSKHWWIIVHIVLIVEIF